MPVHNTGAYCTQNLLKQPLAPLKLLSHFPLHQFSAILKGFFLLQDFALNPSVRIFLLFLSLLLPSGEHLCLQIQLIDYLL